MYICSSFIIAIVTENCHINRLKNREMAIWVKFEALRGQDFKN